MDKALEIGAIKEKPRTLHWDDRKDVLKVRIHPSAAPPISSSAHQQKHFPISHKQSCLLFVLLCSYIASHCVAPGYRGTAWPSQCCQYRHTPPCLALHRLERKTPDSMQTPLHLERDSNSVTSCDSQPLPTPASEHPIPSSGCLGQLHTHGAHTYTQAHTDI